MDVQDDRSKAMRARMVSLGTRVALISLGLAVILILAVASRRVPPAAAFLFGPILGASGAAALTMRRAGRMERKAPRMSAEKLARRWRLLAIGNTLSGILTATVALVLLPAPWAIPLAALMALGVADTWYLARRFRRRVG